MSCLFFIFIILNVKSPECSKFARLRFRDVEIKKSQIAGYGVYATRFIENGTLLQTYDGDWYTQSQWDILWHYGYLTNEDTEYTWNIEIGGQWWFINGNSQNAKWSACVNDNHGAKFEKNIGLLTTYGLPVLWYVASRDIHKGEELFISYGDPYWTIKIL